MKIGVNSVRRYYFRLVSLWLVIFSISLVLAACKGTPTVQPTASPSAPPEEHPTEPALTSTSTTAPTLLPVQRKVILIGSQEQSGELPFAALQSLLHGLAEKDNLLFETVTGLSPADLTDELAIVVALPPDPGITELAAAGQGTQFLAIGFLGLQPASNLSVIGGNSATADKQGLVAGYLAGVISKEWRVGMIGLAGSEQGQLARQGYINGVTFFCGLCRSPYPPFYTYPILVDLPVAASPAEAQTAAETIISQAVNTVFVYPGAADRAMLDTLAQAGIAIIGSSEPSASLSENWVATIQIDPLPAVSEIWPDLLNGQGGVERSLAIALVNRNEQLFSPGRQQLVDQFLADLQAGYIDTGVTLPAP